MTVGVSGLTDAGTMGYPIVMAGVAIGSGGAPPGIPASMFPFRAGLRSTRVILSPHSAW
jgi:hypothetical protein